MRYFRLLKDTPEAEAGTVFEEVVRLDRRHNIYKADGTYNEVAFIDEVVEDQPEWFEEVEQIFVRPKNASRLQEIDEKADSTTGIAEPFTIPNLGPGAIIRVPSFTNVQQSTPLTYASQACEDDADCDCGGVFCE